VSDNHKMWDIWEDPGMMLPWKVQAANFIASFPTEQTAMEWRDAVVKHRKENKL
jgi:hypothetical protein